jgi:small ligand-binding sensory domain FIST
LWIARLPHAEITPIALEFQRTAEGGAIAGWPDALIEDWPSAATVLLLADPFTFPADYLLQRLQEDRPDTVVVGGMASGGNAPGENRLFLDHSSRDSGAVGVVLGGNVRVRSLVSQGCRPIGEPMVVTHAERNLIYQLGGRSALDQLQQLFRESPTHEQQLMQNGLHVGRAVSEYQDQTRVGEFLVRNVLGVDHESGVVAIGDFVRPGQTVQFHLRDERAASDELRQLLTNHRRQYASHGALLFTCNGRGTRLFSKPDHDALAISELLGDIPLAGFFAQGEIGPIGGANFLHGFTASVAVFEDI